MAGDIERGIGLVLRALNKAIDGQYNVMDVDVSNILKKMSIIDDSILSVSGAIEDARTSFKYGKDEFEDVQSDLEAKVRDAITTFKETGKADQDRLKTKALSDLTAMISKTQTEGYMGHEERSRSQLLSSKKIRMQQLQHFTLAVQS